MEKGKETRSCSTEGKTRNWAGRGQYNVKKEGKHKPSGDKIKRIIGKKWQNIWKSYTD